MTLRVLPRTDQNVVANRLVAAGLARSMSPQMYLAIKGGLVMLSIVFGVVVMVSGAMPAAIGILVALGGAAIGYIAPDFFINSRTRGRREQMQMELPNVLDLLCVSVEAGLGFDAAVSKLNERMVGPLVDEFGLVLHEMRIGESRSEALKSLSERVDVPEVSQFARAIIQADQLGIALSRILRVQSHDMRVRRQLAAEEKAMKAPVKMLFPTVIFVFPSMFVVALGPAALNLLHDVLRRRRQVSTRTPGTVPAGDCPRLHGPGCPVWRAAARGRAGSLRSHPGDVAEWFRQRPAKPRTPVRLRSSPSRTNPAGVHRRIGLTPRRSAARSG